MQCHVCRSNSSLTKPDCWGILAPMVMTTYEVGAYGMDTEMKQTAVKLVVCLKCQTVQVCKD